MLWPGGHRLGFSATVKSHFKKNLPLLYRKSSKLNVHHEKTGKYICKKTPGDERQTSLLCDQTGGIFTSVGGGEEGIACTNSN